MEESGDLRASSICEEMRHTLQRAVNHFQDLNRSPVQKVLLCIKIGQYWGWTSQLDQQNIVSCLILLVLVVNCVEFMYALRTETAMQNSLHVSTANWSNCMA